MPTVKYNKEILFEESFIDLYFEGEFADYYNCTFTNCILAEDLLRCSFIDCRFVNCIIGCYDNAFSNCAFDEATEIEFNYNRFYGFGAY